jgi:hypothetical protein
MRDAHRIEDAASCCFRRCEIGVAVEVHHAGIGVASLHSGDDAERYRAVAAQHDWETIVSNNSGHSVSHCASHVNHRREAPRRGLDVIRRECGVDDVTQVHNVDACGAQAAHETGSAQSSGGLLLSGVMGAGAARRSNYRNSWTGHLVTIHSLLMVIV